MFTADCLEPRASRGLPSEREGEPPPLPNLPVAHSPVWTLSMLIPRDHSLRAAFPEAALQRASHTDMECKAERAPATSSTLRGSS